MTPTEIRQIITTKRNQGIDLTHEERTEALKFFTEEEIKCMRHPNFDHTKCFNKRQVKSISVSDRRSTPVIDDNEFV